MEKKNTLGLGVNKNENSKIGRIKLIEIKITIENDIVKAMLNSSMLKQKKNC